MRKLILILLALSLFLSGCTCLCGQRHRGIGRPLDRQDIPI